MAFIQFALTICMQLAPDLLREQLIMQSTTGTAFHVHSSREEKFKWSVCSEKKSESSDS